MNKDFIISEIKKMATENGGRALGKSAFFRATGIKESDWSGKIWARWSDAVREAGFEPQEMQRSLNDEDKVQRLIEVIRNYGKWPTTAEIKLFARNNNGFPSHNTLSGFGNLKERKQRVRDYCKRERDKYQDILSIIPEQVRDDDENDQIGKIKINKKEAIVGYVYLMKSGKYYKIGRSVCAEKRHYELGIQLPEKLQMMHKIATDDPFGVEAYWHNRFKNKRLNGEWFQLTKEDIITFMRRSYM